VCSNRSGESVGIQSVIFIIENIRSIASQMLGDICVVIPWGRVLKCE